MKRILIGLDGSELAEAALPLAEQLAQASGGRVMLVRAVPVGEVLEPLDELNASALRLAIPRPVEDKNPMTGDGAMGEASAYLAGVAQQIRCRGIATEIAAIPGDPADVLVDEARIRHADVVVLATHGRSGVGRLLHGSVADMVLRNSTVPVLLVRATMSQRDLARADRRPRLLIPLDGSPTAESVLPVASDLARSLDAELYLVRIVPSSPASLTGEKVGFGPGYPGRQLDHLELEAQFDLGVSAHRLRSRGLRVKTTIGSDYPPSGIVAAAEDCDASLIVMATHGRHGLERALLGSVALDVLRRSSRPVLLVRPTGTAAVEEENALAGHP